MTYLVHINPIPGSDNRVVEVEAEAFGIEVTGALIAYSAESRDSIVACPNGYAHTRVVSVFSPGVWIYVEPKK